MKPKEEIANLKASWTKDPSWNIEDTEGFEDHRKELKAYSDEQKELWRQDWNNKVKEYAKTYSIANPFTAERLFILEMNLARIEQRLDEITQTLSHYFKNH